MTSPSQLLANLKNRGPVTAALEKWSMDRLPESKRKPDGFWHPSAISGCPSKAFYEQHEFPTTGLGLDARVLRIFDLGTAVHQLLQSQLVAAQVSPVITLQDGTSRPGIEVPFELAAVRMKGSLDAIVEVAGKRSVAEIKTKHSGSFAKLVEPEAHHRIQAACYVIAALELGWITEPMVTFIYYSKDDSHIKELPYHVQLPMVEQVQTTLQMLNGWDLDYSVCGKIPDPFYKEPKSPCRTCPYGAACHATTERQLWLAKIKERDNHAAQAPAQVPVKPVKPAEAAGGKTPVKAGARKLPTLIRRAR